MLPLRICAGKLRGEKRFPIHAALASRTARLSRDQRACSVPSPKDTSAAYIAARAVRVVLTSRDDTRVLVKSSKSRDLATPHAPPPRAHQVVGDDATVICASVER